MTTVRSEYDHSSGPWVDIDLGAVCTNYAMLRDIAPGAEIAAVVKCNAYGLGIDRIASTLAEREHCRTFFVAYPEEGVAVRKALNAIDATVEIYVLSGPAAETFSLFQTANLVPVLNTIEQAELWAREKPGAVAAAHIDTGMNRLGAPMADADRIANVRHLNVGLVMSHLACASSPAHPKNEMQRERFLQIVKTFPNARKSLSASGGALLGEAYQFDLVRAGIALYGGSPLDTDDPRIKPVASLKAPILQIRTLNPGETIGYGATWEIKERAVIATAALGYGDGFPRIASNTAHAFVNGERALLAGRISMDLITLDVTGLRNSVKPGDIVEFFGPNMPIFEVATACKTIPYELLTGLGDRVDRRYL